MNPGRKNPRDSPARIAGCFGHENDPPDLLLRTCPTHAHGRPAGGLRGQRRFGLRLALANTAATCIWICWLSARIHVGEAGSGTPAAYFPSRGGTASSRSDAWTLAMVVLQ